MKRRILPIVLFFVVLTGFCGPVRAAPYLDSVHIVFSDGSEVVLSNEEYKIVNGNVLVKPNYVLYFLPFTVPGKGIWWDGSRKTLIFAHTDSDDYIKERVSIKIGEKQFKDLGETFALRQEAIVEEGRVYLPLRGMAEAYGNKVDYSKDGARIQIRMEKQMQ